MIHGKQILIYRDNVLIAGTKSNSIDCDADTIEVSTPQSGAWREYITSRKKWSITASWLLPSAEGITRLLEVGQSYTIRIATATTDRMTGTAICTQCKITATRGNLVQGSFQFQGSGTLSQVSS